MAVGVRGDGGHMQNNHHPGFRNSLHRIGSAVMKLFHARLELALIESREEIERLERRFILLGLVGFFLTMGCIAATALFVYLLSAAVGIGWSLAIFSFIYFSGAVIAYALIQRERRIRSEPFADTLREFEKDVEQFSGGLEQSETELGERTHSHAPLL
jgi:uncharacterized membrane protein YqjE